MTSYHSTTYQIVFGTKYRRKSMTKTNRRRLYKYIYGICKKYGCFVYCINGVSDHLHIALSIPPKIAASRLIKDIKQYSSVMIKKEVLFENWEGWQVGFFIATYAAEARKNLIRYITAQEKHHGESIEGYLENESYRDELIRLLEFHNIEWDEKYLD